MSQEMEDYKIVLKIAEMIEEIIKILKNPDLNCVICHHAYELFISNKTIDDNEV